VTKDKGVNLNLPQFNGHSERGYDAPKGVFNGETSVPKIFQGVQAGSDPSGGGIWQAEGTSGPRTEYPGQPDWQVEKATRRATGGGIFRQGLPCKQDDDLKRLRRELADAREENEILKKAAAYFARNQR
jgi:hypothetical protein